MFESRSDIVRPREIQLRVTSGHYSQDPNPLRNQRRHGRTKSTGSSSSSVSDIAQPRGMEISVDRKDKTNMNIATISGRDRTRYPRQSSSESSVASTDAVNDAPVSRSEELQRIAKAFALSVAYGANIGGIATLTGTPPNLVLKQQADKLFEAYTGTESDISFAKWMGFAFPLSLFTAVFGWLWLVLVFLRCRCCGTTSPEQRKAINSTIRKQFKKLGRLTFREIEVLVVFI